MNIISQDKVAMINLALVFLLGVFLSVKLGFNLTDSVIFTGLTSSLYAFTMSYIEKIF
jgi:hypothetical protein